MPRITLAEHGSADRVTILPDEVKGDPLRRAVLRTAQGALRGALPPRYARRWDALFFERAAQALAPGAVVLDVGSGRQPAFRVDQRPEGVTYVGFDISRTELERAGERAYDENVVADVTKRVPRLEGRFDLAISRQVFEHVQPLDVAFENLRAYLRPGGRLVALLSGKFSLFALLSQAIPHRATVFIAHRLLGRDPTSVFPAHYDRCYGPAIEEMLGSWSQSEVVPDFRGVNYTNFSRTATSAYLLYEEWAVRAGRHSLATHYLVDAVR